LAASEMQNENKSQASKTPLIKLLHF